MKRGYPASYSLSMEALLRIDYIFVRMVLLSFCTVDIITDQ